MLRIVLLMLAFSLPQSFAIETPKVDTKKEEAVASADKEAAEKLAKSKEEAEAARKEAIAKSRAKKRELLKEKISTDIALWEKEKAEEVPKREVEFKAKRKDFQDWAKSTRVRLGSADRITVKERTKLQTEARDHLNGIKRYANDFYPEDITADFEVIADHEILESKGTVRQVREQLQNRAKDKSDDIEVEIPDLIHGAQNITAVISNLNALLTDVEEITAEKFEIAIAEQTALLVAAEEALIAKEGEVTKVADEIKTEMAKRRKLAKEGEKVEETAEQKAARERSEGEVKLARSAHASLSQVVANLSSTSAELASLTDRLIDDQNPAPRTSYKESREWMVRAKDAKDLLKSVSAK